MSVSHATVTVGLTAVSLTAGVLDPDSTSGDTDAVTRRVVISNEGAAIVYVGGTGVTTSAYGAKLAATTGQITLELGAGDEVFAISGTAGQTVRVLHLT
jgi:hypothetical protein